MPARAYPARRYRRIFPGRSVVEAIAILQGFDLRLEHEVMGGTEITTEGHALLGQATVPEVDLVQAGDCDTVRAAGPDARAKQEVSGVIREYGRGAKTFIGTVGCRVRRKRPDDRTSSSTPACERRIRHDRRVCAVGRDKVDQRSLVAQIVGIVNPVLVWLEPRIPGIGKEHAPGGVQRRVANVTTARDVDRAYIEWQAKDVVLHRPGDKLVDLIGDCS